MTEKKTDQGLFDKSITVNVFKLGIGVALVSCILGVTLYMSLPWTWKVPVDISENLYKKAAISKEIHEKLKEEPLKEEDIPDLVDVIGELATHQYKIAEALRTGEYKDE